MFGLVAFGYMWCMIAEVALATGRPRREIYQRALALAKEGDDGVK